MDARKVLVVVVLAALMLLQPVRGQQLTGSTSAISTPIGLGFSKGTTAPVSEGVPVYVVGDQLWFDFYLPGTASISLTGPCAAGTSATNNCTESSFTDGNSTALQLVTFSSADPTGLWTLTVVSGEQSWSVQFLLVAGGAPTQLSGYGINDDGVMSMTYTLSSDSAYDLSACTAGNQSTSTAYVPIPSAIGEGTLLLTLNGSSVSAIPQGNASDFDVSVGLSQAYGYQIDNQTVVSRETQVAETQPVAVSGGIAGAFTTALDDLLPMRTGEYTLTVNFEAGQTVSVEDTDVLITGTGSWVWLQNCSPVSGELSNTVTVSGSLQEGSSVWPRYVYMLYEEYGVSLFSVVSVSPQPATVTLEAAQWDHQLTDSQIYVSGASGYSVGNGSVYILGTGYPLNVSVGTSQTNLSQVEIQRPYSTLQVQVPADMIAVDTVLGGTQLSGVVVSLTDAEGLVFAENSTAGVAVFYVPQGNYTVAASYDGMAQSRNLDTSAGSAGQSFQATLQFGTGGGPLVLALLAALGTGVIASGAVWTVVLRRRRHLQAKNGP